MPPSEPAGPGTNIARDSDGVEIQAAPNLYTQSTRLRRVLGINLAVALAVIALLVIVFRHRSPASTEIETSMGGAGWQRYTSEQGDPGAKQSRQLVLYRPSLHATDGRLDFIWGVEPAGVAWVFRARDLGNYYAVRIKLVQALPTPLLSIEHFTVSNWAEGSHAEKILVLSRSDPAMRVRMDVFGAAFTVYLQDSAADSWDDGQLTTGGFGFLEDWHQGADIRSVRMSFPQRSGIEPRRPLPELRQFFAMQLTPRIFPGSGGD
ncbi:MAG TPA: hypothetical protein VEV17_08675 [Bryobacteraceae bacterium]|nr:hypothetical protein [Bryobacteraceae bacterium]